ncbi:T-cell surface glycoprotein CD3 gamma chain-like [Labrus mixtus]|uniref:T-cell surface glycoprotein CD3 gamma chain-like n=1 Tax=Labrus mixtus TaxID=508554 RepID=UPI0029C0D7CF|nr:T-cell surface glycoprotein CD3 gamma chain-like [Labrus mixtus]
MRRQILCPVSLLLLPLLWTLTEAQTPPAILEVKPFTDGIEVSCGPGYTIKSPNGNKAESHKLSYRDNNTGEYSCVKDDGHPEGTKIFVKFRTCDNCIELDTGSIVGIAVGDVVATIVIGVAVYIVASQSWIGPIASNKKGSDRQHLVPNEMSNRASNDHYQPLKLRSGQKDTYDVLSNRR